MIFVPKRPGGPYGAISDCPKEQRPRKPRNVVSKVASEDNFAEADEVRRHKEHENDQRGVWVISRAEKYSNEKAET